MIERPDIREQRARSARTPTSSRLPAYREDKLGATLNLLPDLLQGHRGARLAGLADGTQIDAPQRCSWPTTLGPATSLA